jgi:esterase/lipase superfamily enzyme
MDSQILEVPNVASLMRRFLSLLLEQNELTVTQAKQELLRFYSLSEEQILALLPNGKFPSFETRFAWARSYLKTAGFVTAPKRGVFSISESGRKLVLDNDMQLLEQHLNSLPRIIYSVDNYVSGSSHASQSEDKADSPSRSLRSISNKPKNRFGSSKDSVSIAYAGTAPTLATIKNKGWMQTVEVFFGTDRMEDTEKPLPSRFGTSRGQYKLGAVTVSIPPQHKTGNIERPKLYLLEFGVNPEKHMALLSVDVFDTPGLQARINPSHLKSQGSAFVFIHGYNVSFESAALRTAQMAFDLGLKSLPSFFSWPSQDSTSKYVIDEANIEWAQPHIEQYLETFADVSKATEIVVIAHSMGTRAVTRALANLRNRRPDLAPQFKELVLAAPDIDAEVFKRDLLPVLVASAQSVTLYASNKDKALIASKNVHGAPRAGDSEPDVMVEPGLETIDASDIDTDFFGHSYFAMARPLLTDLEVMISQRLRAAGRPQLSAVTTPAGIYWKFRK